MRANKIFFIPFIIFLAVSSIAIAPLNKASAAGGSVPYSFFLEHPYSSTGVRGNLEFVSVDGGGTLVMNQLRADLNLSEHIFGMRSSFSGVTDGVFGTGLISNIGVGTKYAP
jgi:hypothetical protein